MKLIYFFLALVLTASLSGCSKLLDKKPITDLPAEEFWKSKNDLKSGMAGVYSGIQQMLSNNYLIWGDIRSDNLEQGGNNNFRVHFVNALTATTVGSDWTPIYSAIGNINTALKYVATIRSRDASINETEVNDNLAQLYAMRAYCYFTIIRLWGKAPIWTEPYEDITQSPLKARSSVDSVMNLVILPDLAKAISLFDPTKVRVVWYVNAGMAYALLTDVYMWRKEYAKAIEASQNLIGKYDLLPKDRWKELFIAPDQDNSNKAENIWSLPWDWNVNGTSGLYNQLSNGSNSVSCGMDIDLYNRWVADRYTDIRFSLTTDTNSTSRQKHPKFIPVNLDANKMQIYPKNGQQNTHYCIYRMADILLLRAEALVHLNRFPEAQDLINAVKVRAGLKPIILGGGDVEGAVDIILMERQKELFCESKRWYDLVRNDRVPTVMNPIVFRRSNFLSDWGTDLRKILWPINRTVMNSNSLLESNPPYSD
ncbi:RagB/SusD family nutrient uptake outer membrane protein [Paraflavitalea soli]|uniref:RagB/SusD family nutrient uptake outer membrane protein n=1 Tax=Paraflavitalea soli TaxID=2315862 RepID=A0A3B7MIQ8_9BACT|nr:RagB/SusD family nutrient uptake outer membrane protein [Paraflavitalea soli]AXY74324.1 RagB/SusD family nutrient uptake outer membrane protein [Paraflavitalea soli]